MIYSFINKKISIFLNKNLYSKDAIFKCIYWYGDKYLISVSEDFEKENFVIFVERKSEFNVFDEQDSKKFVDKFVNDINDYQLRDIITKETKNIRDLLVAKAFSNGEYDEDPPGEFEDFLGMQK